MSNSSWKPHLEFEDSLLEHYEEQTDEHGKKVYGEVHCGPVLPIEGPPCVRCKYWRPQRNYMVSRYYEGMVFDNGVTLCHKPDYEMFEDFSCFREKETTVSVELTGED